MASIKPAHPGTIPQIETQDSHTHPPQNSAVLICEGLGMPSTTSQDYPAHTVGTAHATAFTFEIGLCSCVHSHRSVEVY